MTPEERRRAAWRKAAVDPGSVVAAHQNLVEARRASGDPIVVWTVVFVDSHSVHYPQVGRKAIEVSTHASKKGAWVKAADLAVAETEPYSDNEGPGSILEALLRERSPKAVVEVFNDGWHGDYAIAVIPNEVLP